MPGGETDLEAPDHRLEAPTAAVPVIGVGTNGDGPVPNGDHPMAVDPLLAAEAGARPSGGQTVSNEVVPEVDEDAPEQSGVPVEQALAVAEGGVPVLLPAAAAPAGDLTGGRPERGRRRWWRKGPSAGPAGGDEAVGQGASGAEATNTTVAADPTEAIERAPWAHAPDAPDAPDTTEDLHRPEALDAPERGYRAEPLEGAHRLDASETAHRPDASDPADGPGAHPALVGPYPVLEPEPAAGTREGESPPSGRRRWWQRIFEFEDPDDVGSRAASNGQGADDSGPGADTLPPALAAAATPEAAAAPRRTLVPDARSGPDGRTDTDETTARTDTDETTAPSLPPPRDEPTGARVPPALGDHRAWVTVPITDEPYADDDEAGVLEPALEPARTGEIPRAPMLGAERARLVPEPEREPMWLQRRRSRRPRVRRVTRVVRRVDTWSVFKVALLFWVVAYLILLVAGVLLWSVAVSTGTVDNVESFIKDLLALDTFTFDGQKIFRASWVLGAFMAVAGTGFTVTLAVLYNLFSDLVGGIRVTVLEEEVVQRPPSPPNPH